MYSLLNNLFGNFVYPTKLFKLHLTVLQLLVLQPGVQPETQRGSSLKTLLSDPYILIAAGKRNLTQCHVAIFNVS